MRSAGHGPRITQFAQRIGSRVSHARILIFQAGDQRFHGTHITQFIQPAATATEYSHASIPPQHYRAAPPRREQSGSDGSHVFILILQAGDQRCYGPRVAQLPSASAAEYRTSEF